MARFILTLPDDLAELIEAWRRREGYKTTAASVRYLIAIGLQGPAPSAFRVPEEPATPKPADPPPKVYRDITDVYETPRIGVHVEAPLGPPKFKPGDRQKKPKGAKP